MRFSQKLVCSGDLFEFVSFGDGPRPTDCSPFIQFYHFALNLANSAMPQYAASIKETFFSPPALILASAASARLDRLTLWMLDLNTMTHRYFTSLQKSSMSVRGHWQNSGCLEIKLINLFFSRLYPSYVTLFFSELAKKNKASQSHYC